MKLSGRNKIWKPESIGRVDGEKRRVFETSMRDVMNGCHVSRLEIDERV